MRWAARLSVAVVLSVVVVSVLAPSALGEHQLVVLAVGFLVGLPHGAVDHLVPFWTGWLGSGAVTMVVVLVGYVSVAALTWVGLHWAGPVVLPVLLAVSVLHFGAGDLTADADEQTERPPAPRAGFVVAVLARGGPVVAGPLLVWPEQAGRALSAVDLQFTLPVLWLRVLFAGVVATCVVIAAAQALRSGHRRSAAEVVLLAALFVAVPPLVAFGVYFGAWHGLRHTARLIVRDPRNQGDLVRGRLLRPLRRFLVSAALPTLVAGGTAAGLIVLAGRDTALTGPVFTLLLALTVPHLVVVAALDLACLRRPTLQSGPRTASTPTARFV